jgi:N6-L-threonylcarbamoyladenine synthase
MTAQHMLILGVETSCDETALALVRDGRVVAHSLVASQIDVHKAFGGVVPEIAAREHLRVIDPLYRQLLQQANVGIDAIDAVAVTRGPGLIGALLVGIAYAKGMALATGKPLIPVDHVHAHVHGALLGVHAELKDVFPTLALVVSGGHTNLYYMATPTSYALLASSVDDACGECFDKVAKLLGLGYPGGPLIEKLAAQGRAGAVAMPKMIEKKDRLEFSYSGLKTYMANYIAREKPTEARQIADLCASFQDEALGQIVRKLKVAAAAHPAVRSILVAGGVAANQRFRALVADAIKLPAYFPPPSYCSDNAAMIAAYGYHVYEAGRAQGATFASADWDAYSRYEYATGGT